VAMTPREARQSIRRAALERRDGILESARAERSNRIAENARDYLTKQGHQSVHVYLSFRSEVTTEGLISTLLARGFEIAVPVIIADGDREHLMQSRLKDISALTVGRFGIHEPEMRDLIPASALDAVCAPLAAFDLSGGRLGYGRGFYDRFLSPVRKRIEVIGLAFDTQEAEQIPLGEHDVPLDVVITESRIIDCKANRNKAIE
jgi:5-formyltetrahydrofolate cyclo-ligase